MGGEWSKTRLADLCDQVDYGHTASAVETPVGPKFLRITDIVSGPIDWQRVPYCPIDRRAAERSRLLPGDIVIARTGATTGHSAYIANPPDAVFASYLIRLRVGQRADPRFVSYFLKSPAYSTYVHGVLGDKSAQPNASAKTLTEVHMAVPPIAEQRAIACILGALDDKIDLNRKMNETLEGIARALFKSWFVNFDPVRAKSEGRDPGLPAEIADPFPSSFVDSELGPIPEGWKTSTVGTHFRLTMGQSPPGSTYNETGEGLPFYQGRTDFGFRFPTHRVFCSKPTRVAERGDTLVSVRAPVGDVNMAFEGCAVGRGVAAIRHRTGGRSLTYYAMRQLSGYFEHFEAEGTVFGCINRVDFERLPFVAAPAAIATAFDRLVSPLDDKIEADERESSVLSTIRDTLLPKLISGELRVPDAERIVGRCV